MATRAIWPPMQCGHPRDMATRAIWPPAQSGHPRNTATCRIYARSAHVRVCRARRAPAGAGSAHAAPRPPPQRQRDLAPPPSAAPPPAPSAPPVRTYALSALSRRRSVKMPRCDGALGILRRTRHRTWRALSCSSASNGPTLLRPRMDAAAWNMAAGHEGPKTTRARTHGHAWRVRRALALALGNG